MHPCPVCGGTAFRRFARMATYSYQRCLQCRLLALDPQPSLEAIEAHYAAKFASGNYQTLLTFSSQYQTIYADYAAWIQRHVTLRGLRTLDIGAFTGGLVSELVAAGADAHGAELQADAVAIAAQRMPGRVHHVNIDAPDSPFANRSLDLVTLMAVIEHVQQPAALLRRVRQLLGDRGWLFLETPNASSWPARATRRYWPLLAPVEHLYLFSEPAIRRALEEADFEIVEIRPHVKWLTPAYVYDMMRNYGPEWRSIVGPIFSVLPRRVRTHTRLPFFSGEMLVAARTRTPRAT